MVNLIHPGYDLHVGKSLLQYSPGHGLSLIHIFVRVQGTARAAAGSHGEVLLALLLAFLLVGAGHRVLAAVSYTHLDVYKRQPYGCGLFGKTSPDLPD